MRKIELEQLDTLLAALAEKAALYLPVDTAAGARYERYEAGKRLSGALNTGRGVKDFFFPQTENLMDFTGQWVMHLWQFLQFDFFNLRNSTIFIHLC